MVLKTIKLAKKVDFIIIDTYSTTSFWYTFFCSQLARIFKTKYIPILHGGNLPVRLKNNPTLSKMVFGHSFANVAPSNYLKKAFLESGFYNTIFIPNVLDINQYNFLERKSLQPNLLWVRAFDKIYNPQMAIDVIKLLQKNYPSATLCMVGPDRDGTLEKTKQYAKNKVVEVIFTGKLSKPEWTLLASKYDFFINTTHIDNTPVSVLEAMALGLSLVSTNVGGIPFLIKDQKDGMLVNDNDSLAMANKIEFLIQNPILAHQLAHSALNKVEQFDWKQVKVLWNNLLQ